MRPSSSARSTSTINRIETVHSAVQPLRLLTQANVCLNVGSVFRGCLLISALATSLLAFSRTFACAWTTGSSQLVRTRACLTGELSSNWVEGGNIWRIGPNRLARPDGVKSSAVCRVWATARSLYLSDSSLSRTSPSSLLPTYQGSMVLRASVPRSGIDPCGIITRTCWKAWCVLCVKEEGSIYKMPEESSIAKQH